MATKRPRAELDQELIDAAFVCDFIKVRSLLEQGAHPDARDEDGRTPLFSAVLGGSVGLIGLLLEAPCDVNAKDHQGWTALHFTAQEYLPQITRLLIGRGADVNAQDEEGNSVLWRAVFSSAGRDEVIQILREHGAKDNLPNRAGESARQLAERVGVPYFDKTN
jgi:uncharacterized protein